MGMKRLKKRQYGNEVVKSSCLIEVDSFEFVTETV